MGLDPRPGDIAQARAIAAQKRRERTVFGENTVEKARTPVVQAARETVDQIIQGDVRSTPAAERLRKLGLSHAEKADIQGYSRARSKQSLRANDFQEQAAGFVLGPDLAKLLPGGTPASEASMGGLALDAALLAPGSLIGRPLGYGLRVGKKGAEALGGLKPRTFKANDLAVTVPAAKSRMGRKAEGLLDRVVRPVLGKTPLVRTEAEKTGSELGRSAAIKSKLETAPAQALQRIGRRLSPAQEYTLRVLAEKASIAERVALHENQASTMSGLNRLFHETHVQLLKGASKYVDETSGMPVLRADAPSKLKRAYGLLLDVDRQAAGILKDIGRLSDETIRARISAPGKVFKGARFVDVASAQRRMAQIDRGIAGLEREAERLATQARRLTDKRIRANRVDKVAEGRAAQFDQLSRLADDAQTLMDEAYEAFQRGELPARDLAHLQDEAKRVMLRYERAARAASELADGAVRRQRLTATSTALRERWSVVDAALEAAGAVRRTVEESAGKFVGPGADFAGGEAFVSYARGIPGLRLRGLGAYARATAQMFGGGGRRTIGKGADDAYLRKAFKGKSILTGRFRTDTANVAAESLLKASRLSAARLARTEFRAAATDLPRSPSDLPIREDFLLGKAIPDDLRKVWEVMDAAEAGGRKLGFLEMDAIEGNTLQRLNDWMFPKGEYLADDVVAAIPGVKWLPAGFAYESRLFDVPAANRMAMQAWGKFARSAGMGLGGLADVGNLILKAATLWLNPSYGPIQLTQNSIRLLSEEGPLALARIPQAWALSKKLTPVDLAKVDNLMQMDVLVKARSDRLIGKLVEPMAKFWTIFADLGPRRAAFLNVAAKAGYDTPAKLARLLNDNTVFPELEQITRRSLDVMGDFERMNGFEKTVMSRVFWFWPWTHVAWRMSARFPLDHPWQAAALTYAAYEGKQYADEKLGERPWYAQTYLPTDFVGEAGEGGKINVGPLLPQGTPLQQAQTALGFLGLQQDGPKVADSLVPSLGAFGEAAYGVDASTGRPVDGGLPGAVKRQLEGIPPIRKFNDLTRSDEEVARDQEKKLVPRSRAQAWLAVPFGAFAPTGYNREVGERIVRRQKERRGQGPKLRLDDALKDIASGFRRGEITDEDAATFRELARAEYEAEIREKELKRRGLNDADLDRQLVVDDGVRQGVTLEEVNDFLKTTGFPPINAEEYEKTERELLRLDVQVGK